MAPSKVVKKFSTKKNKKNEDVEMKPVKAAEVSEQSSSDSSDSDSSDSEVEKEEQEKGSESSDSGDSSDSEEEEEKVNDKKRKASEDSDDESEEDDEEEEEDKKEVKKQKPNVTISKEEPPRFGGEGLSVWVGQLNFDATVEQVEEFFEKAGKVTSVRMAKDNRGGKQNRGFCYVDFETAEDVEAAKKLNGEEFLGRNIKIDEAGAAKPRQKDEKYSAKSKTVFVANLSHDLTEEGIREAFEPFGTIHEVRMPWNKEADRPKGIAYIEFDNMDEAEKAVLEMNGVRVNNRPVRTDFAGSKPDNNDRPSFRGGGRGGFRGGRGDFRGGRGDFRGGRGDFRGGRGDFRGGRGDFRGGRGGRR